MSLYKEGGKLSAHPSLGEEHWYLSSLSTSVNISTTLDKIIQEGRKEGRKQINAPQNNQQWRSVSHTEACSDIKGGCPSLIHSLYWEVAVRARISSPAPNPAENYHIFHLSPKSLVWIGSVPSLHNHRSTSEADLQQLCWNQFILPRNCTLFSLKKLSCNEVCAIIPLYLKSLFRGLIKMT